MAPCITFATRPFAGRIPLRVVAVAQLVEHRIVAPKVAGSSPVGHPFICRQNVRAGSYTGPLLLQPYCNPLPERFVQPFYSIAAYALQEVRVAVHRLRDGGVP